MINTSQTVTAKADVTMADLEDEAVLLNITTGHYFGLNQVGRRIWTLLEQPRQVGDLVDHLAGDYDVPRSDLESDVLAFLGRLHEKGLIDLA